MGADCPAEAVRAIPMPPAASAATGSAIQAAACVRDIFIGTSVNLGSGLRPLVCVPAGRLPGCISRRTAAVRAMRDSGIRSRDGLVISAGVGPRRMPSGHESGARASSGRGDMRSHALWESGGLLSPEEFTEFYAASFRRLVGQLYAMTGDRAEAQDAVQEAFIRAWEHRGKLDRLGAPEAWVRTAAWRIAVSRWRRARAGLHLMASHSRPEIVDGPGPDRVALIDALRKVPAEQRRALVLYHLCDLSVDQIAAEDRKS